MTDQTERLTLVSHALCPYVQRAAIVLVEKAIAFDRRYIDLADKPDWFQRLSPLGKVPLLLVERDEGVEEAIFESAVICEYLEETQPHIALHPADALRRANHRGWIEFGSSILADLWLLETAKTAPAYDRQRQILAGKFARVEADLTRSPYFDGSRFSMVDATYAPIFRYFDVFDTLADTRILAEAPKVLSWRRALAARSSVAQAAPTDYADRLRSFLSDQDAYLLRLSA